MPHYKSMFDESDMLFAHNLQGRDVTVEIVKVYAGDLIGEKGRKTKKPFLVFKGTDKKLAINKTNGKTIAKLYGTEVTDWVGKRITIFPTTTEFGGETVDCIRVRPKAPEGSKPKERPPAPPPSEDGEPRNTGEEDELGQGFITESELADRHRDQRRIDAMTDEERAEALRREREEMARG